MVDSVQVQVLEVALAGLPAGVEVVAGIGGGMAVDTAKYFAWRRALRLVTIPTALTVDAFVTPPAGVRKGNDHTVDYVGAAQPDPLVIDFDLIRTAPTWLNVAGVGDILSCHTACWDWELAQAAGRSADCPFSAADVAAARAVLQDTLAAARDIASATDAGLRALVHGYMKISALCLPAGHPRAEEGSEHFVLYVLESRLKRGFIHGHIVGLGIYLMARLQGNDAERIIAAMRDMGLRFDPENMDLTREDVRSALLALKAFKAGRPDLFYTVIDEATMDEAWVDGALQGLAFSQPKA
jgi:glycerol-1-phosphate dehydrogenase [NAD(P)+]